MNLPPIRFLRHFPRLRLHNIIQYKPVLMYLFLPFWVSSCALMGSSQGFQSSKPAGHTPANTQTRLIAAEEESEETEPGSIPYRVDGNIYYPLESGEGYDRKGVASWYGPKFHGKPTSNQETYDMHSLTAAHKTLPFNTRVRVTNLSNGRSVVVRINDRGPFVGNRIIDLSYRAGIQLGMVNNGTAPVRVQALESIHSSAGNERYPIIHQARAFTVQAGVFKSRDNAGRLARQLGDGKVTEFTQSGETLYRVVTRAYNTFDQAQVRMDRLRSEGLQGAFVIAAPAP